MGRLLDTMGGAISEARSWGVSRRTALAGGVAALGGCAGADRLGRADGGDLEAVLDRAMADSSTSLLVRRAGEVLAERYAPGWSAERPREVASVAKSMVAVLIGMALEDGRLEDLVQPLAGLVPQWRDDPRREITLRHLMSMTSGLDDRGLALRGITGDQFSINAGAPLRDPPGARWAYNTAAYHLLFHILVRATGEDVEPYARRRLLGPLGMDRTRWLTGAGRGAQGPVTNYYSAVSTARDLAAFAGMVMQGGSWNGRRLVSADFLREAVAPSQDLNPSYGLLWWTNARPGVDAFGRNEGLRFPAAPPDTLAALGAGGQAVLIVPSREVIVIRQGDPPGAHALPDALLGGVLGAIAR